MFSEVTDENGSPGSPTRSVEKNIEALAELGITVTPELWDRSLLEEIFADGPTI